MRYFTVKEFAKKISVCDETIRRAIKKKRIYALTIGLGCRHHYRIPETELERIQLAGQYKE